MPSMLMSPALGCSTPSTILMVVVLPAPLGPSRPTISPACTPKEMPSTATVVPYSLRRPSTRSAQPTAPAGLGTLMGGGVRGRRQLAPGQGCSGSCRHQCGSPPGCESSLGKVCTSPDVARPDGTAAGGGAALAGAGAGAVEPGPLALAATAAKKRRADSEWGVTLFLVIIAVVTSSSL